jgi:transcriptional activator
VHNFVVEIESRCETAKEARILADLMLGRHLDVLPELQAMPDRTEQLNGCLMVALQRSGRHAEALEVFHQVRRAAQELAAATTAIPSSAETHSSHAVIVASTSAHPRSAFATSAAATARSSTTNRSGGRPLRRRAMGNRIRGMSSTSSTATRSGWVTQ